MSRLTDIADAVVAKLNAATFSEAFVAVLGYDVQYDIEEMSALHVTVLPATLDQGISARRFAQEDIRIEIGVQKKLPPKNTPATDAVEIGELISLTEAIGDFLRGESLADFPAATWISQSIEPVVSRDLLREKRLFTSVIAVNYRVVFTD